MTRQDDWREMFLQRAQDLTGRNDMPGRHRKATPSDNRSRVMGDDKVSEVFNILYDLVEKGEVVTGLVQDALGELAEDIEIPAFSEIIEKFWPQEKDEAVNTEAVNDAITDPIQWIVEVKKYNEQLLERSGPYSTETAGEIVRRINNSRGEFYAQAVQLAPESHFLNLED